MEESGFTFDDFSVETQDFEFKKVKTFDRIWRYTSGGSFDQNCIVHNGKLYAASMDQNVYCLDAKTGELVWKFRAERGFLVASAVYYEGNIYIGSYDYNMYALDAETGKLKWKFFTRGEIMASALVENGRVYFGSRDQNVYCLDAKTGELVWKHKTFGEVLSAPRLYEGRLYVGSFDHNVYCLDAKTGELVWKHRTEGEIMNPSPFPIHDRTIYFGSFDNNLRAVDIDTGKLVWKHRTGTYGGMSSTTLYCKERDMLLQTNREGVIYALSLDGREIWRYRITPTMAEPTLYDGRIYFGSENQNLHCLDLDGKLLWKFPTQGAIWGEVLEWESIIFFTSMDCFVYAIDKDTRQLIWKFKGQGQPSKSPPPFESFELQMKIRETPKETEARKTYGMELEIEDEETGSFYKSRITYQVSTQYAAKGKYQKDSDEEAL